MKTTDTMRQALAWCDRRGLWPDVVHSDGRIDFHTRGRAELDSREAFVALCREAGVLGVPMCGTHLWAVSVVDGFKVTVHGGSWSRGLDPAAMALLADEVRHELLAVRIPA